MTSITIRPFGRRPSGEAVTRATLTWATGLSFDVVDYGATLGDILIRPGQRYEHVTEYRFHQDG